jgi:integrase
MMTAAKLVNGQKPRFGLHALRHAACSNWIAVKASKLQVKEWAGHHSVEFTIDVYGHLWPEDKKPVDLIEQAGRFILQ